MTGLERCWSGCGFWRTRERVAELGAETVSPHYACRRQARNLVAQITFRLNRLKIYGLDKCPTAGITPRLIKQIKTVESKMDKIRRALL